MIMSGASSSMTGPDFSSENRVCSSGVPITGKISP